MSKVFKVFELKLGMAKEMCHLQNEHRILKIPIHFSAIDLMIYNLKCSTKNASFQAEVCGVRVAQGSGGAAGKPQVRLLVLPAIRVIRLFLLFT